jgi:hypothetical protein
MASAEASEVPYSDCPGVAPRMPAPACCREPTPYANGIKVTRVVTRQRSNPDTISQCTVCTMSCVQVVTLLLNNERVGALFERI